MFTKIATNCDYAYPTKGHSTRVAWNDNCLSFVYLYISISLSSVEFIYRKQKS